ncbi:helix-turn-helix domain-containing protein [Paenibacillus tarimensis]
MDRRVGKRIRLIRQAKGIYAKFVADKLKIHASTFCKYETGERGIDADMLPAIADILNVNVQDFYDQNLDVSSKYSA